MSPYRWHAWENRRPGGGINGPYARTNMRQPDGTFRYVKMHELITGCKGIDHRDGDPLNNQDDNLRKATKAENNHNRKPNVGGSSPYKGVSWNTRAQRWRAQIRCAGVHYNLGFFTDEADAARVYDAKAHELHGEFAWLNFPDDPAPPARGIFRSIGRSSGPY